MNENYAMTPADIRAVTDGREDGEGFGGNWMWIIVLFLFMFMGGGAGFGGRNGAGVAEMQQGFDNASVDRRLNQISNGICDSTFALNNSILTEGRAMQTQLGDCCCEMRLGLANLGAMNERNTCTITTAIHAEGEQTRALIQQNEMQALRDKVSDLQLAQSQCAQNDYLTRMIRPYPVPAYNACNPNSWGGCGCGCA